MPLDISLAMGRPLRNFIPNQPYFVTNRIAEGVLLLVPIDEVNGIIEHAKVVAANHHPVRSYGDNTTSNHFHDNLSAEDPAAIPRFMQLFQSLVARKINRRLGRKGPVWERRYSAEPILDDEASVERLRYTIAHGVKENLVATVEQWPAVSATKHLLGGSERTVEVGKGEGRKTLRQPFAPLPCWRDLSAAERGARVQALIDDINAEATAKRAAEGKQPLGLAALLAQDPRSKPAEVKYSPRPLCHATDATLRVAYKTQLRELRVAYDAASARYRAGDFAVEFPEYTFPPPLVFGVAARASPLRDAA